MITKNVGSFRFVCGMGMNRGSLILVGPPQVERLGIWQPAKQYSPFADGDKDRSQSASPAPSGYPLFSTSPSMYQRRPGGPLTPCTGITKAIVQRLHHFTRSGPRSCRTAGAYADGKASRVIDTTVVFVARYWEPIVLRIAAGSTESVSVERMSHEPFQNAKGPELASGAFFVAVYGRGLVSSPSRRRGHDHRAPEPTSFRGSRRSSLRWSA